MKPLLLLALFFCILKTSAQNVETDSLKNALSVEDDNIKRVSLLEGLSYAYLASYPDTALLYATQGFELANKINYRKGEAICLDALGNVYFHVGNNAKALELYFKYLALKEELKEYNSISVAYFNIASVYTEQKDYRQALTYLFKAKKQDEKLKDSAAILYDLYSLGNIYLYMNLNDSALYYSTACYKLCVRMKDENMIGAALNTLGESYFALNDEQTANNYFRESIPYVKAINDNEVLTANYFGLAKIFKQQRAFDSSSYYAHKALQIAEAAPFYKQVLEISNFLISIYGYQKRFDSAFYYQQLSIKTKDGLFNTEEVKKIESLKLQEQQRQQQLETARLKYRNNVKMFIAIFIAVIILVIAITLWRSNKQKQKSNALLTSEKQKVENALSELKSTQSQLIQREKMASLGELTAGIAHEIQNPLNFVNNFSEVNDELISELVDEVGKGNTEEVKAIATDIKQNLEKINHHGKRADAIVKNMLQHSRQTKGIKASTDINALCDEYLRLSYHGLSAKNKNFNAVIKTDFDSSIDKINIVAQDVGRALLNVFNNAFYALNEKQNSESLTKNAEYKPTVSIETKTIIPIDVTGRKVEIKVNDNGNGIPQSIIDKIFQPFFTTKPAGQGTGLGLSLAYDIITKEHNGTIQVESKEGEGSTFIIQLPC